MSNEQYRVCQSCGVPWVDHLGIQGTCAQLMRMNKNYADLAQIALNADRERIEFQNRIRVLEFQNAELRAHR